MALLWIIVVAAIVLFASKISDLSKRIKELDGRVAKESELKLLFSRIKKLESHIDQLREKIGLKGEIEPPPAMEIKEHEEEIPPPEVLPERPPLPTEPEAPTIPHPPVIPSPPPEPRSIPVTKPKVSIPARPARPSRTKEEWEALIGGKLLNRIGALALIIGIGFFLKYAFDRNWITETMRVLIGVIVGLALLYGGRRLHKKDMAIFAQGLIGTGISVLYLSVYAAFNFYHLIPQVIAFVFMSLVTALTIVHALKYDSLAVSILGWAGGFLTPLLLSTGQANELGLFTYVALLDVGFLVVALRRDPWIILEPLTFGATALTFLAWYQRFYTPADLPLTVLLLSILWGLFYFLDAYRIVKGSTSYPEIRQAMAALNAALYYAGMHTIINPRLHDWMALVTVVIGAVYFATILVIRRKRSEDRLVVARYLLTSIVMLVLATTTQFEGFTTVIFWSVEAFLLVWCGTHWKFRYVWAAALGLFGLAFVKMMGTEGVMGYTPISSFKLIFNQRALTFSVLAAALGGSTSFFRSDDEGAAPLIRAALHYAWGIVLFGLCTVEVTDYFRWLMIDAAGKVRVDLEFTRMMILPAIWMVYSLILAWCGLRRSISPIFHCSLGALCLSVVLGTIWGIAFSPIEWYSPLLNIRACVLAFIIAGLFAHLYWFKKNYGDDDRAHQVLAAFHYAWCIVLFILCTVETNDYFRWLLTNPTWGTGAGHSFTRLMTLAGVWVIYSLPIARYALGRDILPVLHCGLASLGAGFLLGTVRGAWFAFEGLADFKVVLNLRAGVLALCLIALLIHIRWLKRKCGEYKWLNGVLTALQYGWCIVLLVLCTSETNDYFRHLIHMRPEKATELVFDRSMLLGAIWTIYSMPLAWHGLRKDVLSVLYCGTGALSLAIAWIAILGITFVPIDKFHLLLNLRGGVLLLLILASFAYYRWLMLHRKGYGWADQGIAILRAIIVVLILETMTTELWDFFTKEAVLLKKGVSSLGIYTELKRLTDLKQLSLSGSWLIYSIILLAIGIWRRVRQLRIIAIILFGVTILKIFIYDLSFLGTLYRIISFIALGIILLATSYLYQRYKTVIFGETTGQE